MRAELRSQALRRVGLLVNERARTCRDARGCIGDEIKIQSARSYSERRVRLRERQREARTAVAGKARLKALALKSSTPNEAKLPLFEPSTLKKFVPLGPDRGPATCTVELSELVALTVSASARPGRRHEAAARSGSSKRNMAARFDRTFPAMAVPAHGNSATFLPQGCFLNEKAARHAFPTPTSGSYATMKSTTRKRYRAR